MTLNWVANRDPDLKGYHLYRSTLSGNDCANVGVIPPEVTFFIDAGLTNGTAYFYRLRAVDMKGQTRWRSAPPPRTEMAGAAVGSFLYPS